MKSIALIVSLLCVSTAHAQSVCQTRWFGGGFWTATGTPGVSAPTFSPLGVFTFEYPGEEGAAEIIATSARVPSVFYANREFVYGIGAGGVTALYPAIPNGIEFGAYLVKETGLWSGPYQTGAMGLKLTKQHDAWQTFATNKAYDEAIFVETWVLVRVCGTESQLLKYYGPVD